MQVTLSAKRGIYYKFNVWVIFLALFVLSAAYDNYSKGRQFEAILMTLVLVFWLFILPLIVILLERNQGEKSERYVGPSFIKNEVP